jgi:hypothetical protein
VTDNSSSGRRVGFVLSMRDSLRQEANDAFFPNPCRQAMAVILSGSAAVAFPAMAQHYQTTKLTADQAGVAANPPDGHLLNPWGLSRSSGSPWWVSDNENIGGDLYVTFAQQEAAKHDENDGAGLGYVDVFSPRGELLRRFEHGDWLNASWGLALASGDFGNYSHDLLGGSIWQRKCCGVRPPERTFSRPVGGCDEHRDCDRRPVGSVVRERRYLWASHDAVFHGRQR